MISMVKNWCLLLLLALTANAYGQDCPSYLDTRFNPLLVQEMGMNLNLKEIDDCYSGNSVNEFYEKYFLSGAFYGFRNIDSSGYFYEKLLRLCFENDVSNDRLAFALYLNGEVALKTNRKELSELFFEAAIQHLKSPSLKAICQLYWNIGLGKNPVFHEIIDSIESYRGKMPVEDFYTFYLTLDRINLSFVDILDEAFNKIHLVENDFLKLKILEGYFKNQTLNADYKEIGSSENRTIEFLNDYQGDGEIEFIKQRTRAAIENLNREYLEYNNTGKKTVELREINLNDFLAGRQKIASNSDTELTILFYAKTLLFLTREGKGIQPVIEAYNIYLKVIENRYVDMHSSYTLLKSYSQNTVLLDNILVVGNYLSEKTGEIHYLRRAWSAVNAVNSLGLQWNIVSSQCIQNNEPVGELIKLNREKERDLFNLTESWRNDYSNEKLSKLIDRYDDYYKRGEEIIKLLEQGSLTDITKLLERTQLENLSDSTSILLFSSGGHKHCLLINQDTIIQKNLVRFLQDASIISGFQRQVGSPESLAAKTGYNIYATFLKDLQPYLNKHVAIIASDEFETFPFSALPTDTTANPAYLGDDHIFSYHHSLRTYQNDLRDNNRSDNTGVLALAPRFTSTVQYASRRTTDGTEDLFLTPLRYNTQEIKSLEQRYPGDFYVGEQANKNTFLRQAPHHRVIHLATHAVADVGDGEQSALFLDYPDKDGSLEKQSLKAGEVSNLILDADLVILSACETGLGTQLLNEGTIGLTRAFTSAGARSILSTLWAVDDRATSEIVLDFYEQLDAGKSKSVALATAQRNFRAKHAGTEKDHPYYWAPLILVGNNAPLTDLDASPLPWFWIIIAIALLISLPFLLRRTRKTLAA
ncbi:hypothetical protein CEQ90_07335 [Lewinellaceae bacterium SD302]|nr:hypothetical protein CEQ90_07335 [Lewinellaceae bacterium SD302]